MPLILPKLFTAMLKRSQDKKRLQARKVATKDALYGAASVSFAITPNPIMTSLSGSTIRVCSMRKTALHHSPAPSPESYASSQSIPARSLFVEATIYGCTSHILLGQVGGLLVTIEAPARCIDKAGTEDCIRCFLAAVLVGPVSYTHLRAHETEADL
eukprot:3219193-Amphidinium_carterae.1